MDPIAEASYAELVRTRWRDLVRAAVFLGASHDEAQDLAQHTLVRCYAAWERVSRADNVEAYLYRMLLNQLRDARRTRWWRSRVDLDVHVTADGVSDTSEELARVDAVHRALGGLTKAHRDVVVLRYFVQLTEAQAAEALGVPPGTVKSRLSRALAQLAASDHLSDLAEESR